LYHFIIGKLLQKNLRQKLLKWTVFAGHDKIEESPMIIPPENYCMRQRFVAKIKWKKSVVKDCSARCLYLARNNSKKINDKNYCSRLFEQSNEDPMVQNAGCSIHAGVTVHVNNA
jgi:hypothetical protein